MAKIYCSNEGCRGREQCAKALPMQEGDAVRFFGTGYYADRCREFESIMTLERPQAHSNAGALER